MLATHDMPLQCAIINLSPPWMQARKDFILTAPDQRLYLLQAKFMNPLTIGQEISHRPIKHRHRYRSILHESTEAKLHVFMFGALSFKRGES